jgi:hypothetical protein
MISTITKNKGILFQTSKNSTSYQQVTPSVPNYLTLSTKLFVPNWMTYISATLCEGQIWHKLSKFCQKVPHGIL